MTFCLAWRWPFGAVPVSRTGSLRVVLLPLCLLAAQGAHAQERGKSDREKKSAEEQAAKEFQAYAKSAAQAYAIKIHAADGNARKKDQHKAVLREEPILRWTNP